MNIEIQKFNTAIQSYERWTPTAIFCYERGCRCKDCPINKMLETKCKMKVTVIMLVSKFGTPTNKFHEQ